MAKKVLIIGGGIYGLATGSFLARNGFDTEIYEMHSIPGGVCTAWSRKGYTFDFCIHWLMGTAPNKSLYRVWEELGAVQGKKMHETDVYLYWKNKDGESFTVYTDPERLREEMLRLGPLDAPFINSFIKDLIKLKSFDMPATSEEKNLGFLFSMIPYLGIMSKWGSMNMQGFATRFKSPVLRQFFSEMYPEDLMPDFPVTGMIFMLAFMAAKSNGYPLGGSLEFIKSIEATYKKHGGKINYNNKVSKILVEDGKAVGIVSNGREIRGDYVISAADGYMTFNQLLDGKYHDEKHGNAYRNWKIFPALIFMSMGVKREFPNMPAMNSLPAKNPLVLEDGKLVVNQVNFRLFNFDPSMAPKSSTAITSMINTFNDGYWVDLYQNNPKKYAEEKKRIGDWLIEEAEHHLGGIKNSLEVIDVATPATIIRYTGNWHGSYEGWLPNKKNMLKSLPDTLKGLDNFYMIGQWISPGGGLPPAAMNGRELAERLCKKEKIRFSAESAQ